MIHHISIAANNPLRVAKVLAELWQGDFVPFPEHEGSYVALPYDSHGTLIVVLPKGTEITPDPSDQNQPFVHNASASDYTATHAAISVPVSEAKIQDIAAREGWQAATCSRQGYFDVVELWIENQQLIELLPPTFISSYLAFTQPLNLKRALAALASARKTQMSA